MNIVDISITTLVPPLTKEKEIFLRSIFAIFTALNSKSSIPVGNIEFLHHFSLNKAFQ